MEKSNPVDQLPADQRTRHDRARTFILANRTVFARQGSVVASYRRRAGKRFGPYYRLAWRSGGRQRSLYLGPRPVAELIHRLIAELQKPLRVRRYSKRLQAQVRRSIRRAKKELARQLARIGVTVKGWEFRGAATALSQYRPLNPYPP